MGGWRFEQRGYAAGSYQLIGGTVNESWTVSTGSNNLQHHISQIPAGGTYNLKSGTNVLATLTTSADRKNCFVIFGKVLTKNTRWLFEDALTLKNARLELQDILVHRATEDDFNEYHSCREGYSMLFQLLP